MLNCYIFTCSLFFSILLKFQFWYHNYFCIVHTFENCMKMWKWMGKNWKSYLLLMRGKPPKQLVLLMLKWAQMKQTSWLLFFEFVHSLYRVWIIVWKYPLKVGCCCHCTLHHHRHHHHHSFEIQNNNNEVQQWQNHTVNIQWRLINFLQLCFHLRKFNIIYPSEFTMKIINFVH